MKEAQRAALTELGKIYRKVGRTDGGNEFSNTLWYHLLYFLDKENAIGQKRSVLL